LAKGRSMSHLDAMPTVVQATNHINKVYSPQLSDQDIFELQDIFLSKGYHHILVASVSDGRALMQSFLQSLRCYHSCAVLTHLPVENLPLISIYEELKPYLQQNSLEPFFMDQFYYDFVWIESTPSLFQAPWYIEFEQWLLELKLYLEIPIIITRTTRTI